MNRGLDSSPRCEECPFKTAKRVPGEGSENPLWIVVGEGPGENERMSGRPFAGASGELLGRAFRSVGVDRTRDVWMTNALLCTPRGASDVQKARARECCEQRLRDELVAFPEKPVLLLGALAAEPVIGDASVLKVAGALHDADLGGKRYAIPTLHPTFILRGGTGDVGAKGTDLLYWNLVYDVGKVHALAQGRLKPFVEDIAYEHSSVANTETLIEAIVGDARKSRLVALDTETTSLAIVEAEIRAIALATEECSVSVRWDLLTPRARRLLRACLADSTIDKVIHNRLYDVPIMYRHGFPLAGTIHDTLLAHHNAFPGLPHDLQRVATQLLLVRPWKSEFRGSEETWDALLRYNALDALVTARLHVILQRHLEQTKTTCSYAVDLDMAEIAEGLELVGIPIDRQVNAALADRFRSELATSLVALRSVAEEPSLRAKLLDRLALEQAKTVRKDDAPDFLTRHAVRLADLERMGCTVCRGKGKVAGCTNCDGKDKVRAPVILKGNKVRTGLFTCAACEGTGRIACPTCEGAGTVARPFEFNPAASAHVIAFLKARGVPLLIETSKGKTSTERRILEGLRHVPEVTTLLEFREAGKMLSTFVEKIGAAVRPNGRVYPRWNVHMLTGRWSAEAPNLQNWPRANKKRNRPNLRAQIVAPEGHRIVGFDYDKQEARVIAFLSGDPYLIDIFSTGKNIHEVLARLVWPAFRSKKEDPELYDFIKRTEYGAFYGGSIDTLWQNLLKDDPTVRKVDVQHVVDLLQGKLLGIQRWHADLLRVAATPPHELRSFVYGRRRVFPLGNFSPTDVYNWPVQTFGAEVMQTGLRRLQARGLPEGAEMILQIHDAAYFECPEVAVPDMEQAILACFPQTYEREGFKMDFPVEVHSGRSLADL